MKKRVGNKKKKFNQLDKKLLAYSLSAGAALALVSPVRADVIHTDINPDTTVNTNGGFYLLDLNNDGNNDFRLTHNGSPYTNSVLIQKEPSGLSVIGIPMVSALESNYIISSGKQFNSGTFFLIGYRFSSYYTTQTHTSGSGYTTIGITNTGSGGNWNNVSNRFLGLKFNIGGNTHYGWTRLSVGNNYSQFTVHDYAYETTPDLGIRAGEEDQSLPVELTSFSAEVCLKSVKLIWVTASEINNLRFYLERSPDNKKFESIAEIPGQGNSSHRTEYNYEDMEVQPGKTYYYRLTDQDYSGKVKYHQTIKITAANIPDKFILHANYPNPFNPETNIRFEIPASANGNSQTAELLIYNNLGQKIRTIHQGVIDAGEHLKKWDGANDLGVNQPSGIYYLTLIYNNLKKIQKMVLMR